MATTLDKFRAKLVIKIFYARSAEEADRFIHAAIRAMEKAKVNAQIIGRFVDRVLNQLSFLESSAARQVQLNNIRKAVFSLENIRNLMGTPTGINENLQAL